MRIDRHFRLTVGMALVVALLLCPGCVTPASGGSGTRISISSDTDDGWARVKVARGWSSLELELRGEVKLSEDDSEVVSIERGGSFLLVEREGLRVRRVRIESDRGGRLIYSGNAADTDDEARAWVAARLPGLIEESGVWAEDRALRLLRGEGVEAVLAKVETLGQDHTKAVYLGVLLDEAELTEGDFERMQRVVAREVESDYYAAEVLQGMLAHRVGRTVTGAPLFDAINEIDSAYHRTQLLRPLADRASSLDLTAYLAAVGGVDSDYHQQEVLARLLDQADLDDASMIAVLELVRRIGSDYHSADLLRRLTGKLPRDPAALQAYFEAVRAMDSDHHRQEVLSALVRKNSGPAALALVVDVAGQLGSDYHKAHLLAAVVREAGRDEALLLKVIEASAGLDSDHHLTEVLETILDQRGLSDPVLKALLATVKQQLDSGHRRGRLLDRITDRMTT